MSINGFSPLSLDLFQGACWWHVLSLEPMSVEQILITTLFTEKVRFVYSELTWHISCSLLHFMCVDLSDI